MGSNRLPGHWRNAGGHLPGAVARQAPGALTPQSPAPQRMPVPAGGWTREAMSGNPDSPGVVDTWARGALHRPRLMAVAHQGFVVGEARGVGQVALINSFRDGKLC